MSLTIGGDGDDWKVFSRNAQTGNKILFRSRTQMPAVEAYASENQMARLRCALAESEIGPAGLPKSTKDLDDFEDSLIGALEAANAEVYLIAIVTSEGNRDLFFAARDLDDLRAGIKAAKTDVDTFKLELAPIGDIPAYLKQLSLSDDQLAKANYHGVPIERGDGGGFLGKLFGR